MSNLLVPILLTLIIAALYTSVGHGGASGYLALFACLSIPHGMMSSSALCLNLLCAGISFFVFRKAGAFSWKLARPFLAGSLPAALIGGMFPVSRRLYMMLLAVVLLVSAIRLLMEGETDEAEICKPPVFLSVVIGIGIGLISGIVGVGGGIFLSPLLIFFRWASARQTAAVSACFILLNSLAGLFGRLLSGNFQIASMLVYLTGAAFLGAMIGSRLGAFWIPNLWLKRILGFILMLAILKTFV